MLKKSLIAIAVLALAMPAFAGDAKFHDWPCQYVPQEIACLKVLLDIGFYVHIEDQGPIVLEQYERKTKTISGFKNHPYYNYRGEKCTDVITNFPATLSLDAEFYDGVDDWIGDDDMVARFDAYDGPKTKTIGIGETNVCIFVTVKEVDLSDPDAPAGGSLGVEIGEVCIEVVPAAGAFASSSS
ncbi:hypothetical protein ACFL6U_24160 [Planctomycetota bacterium]